MPEENNITEIWKEIPGYEGIYEASALGWICRIIQKDGGIILRRILRPDRDRSGYHRVVLYKYGARKRWLVHSLVLAAFAGRKPDNFETNHESGDKGNNSFANLEYITPSQNKLHRYRILGQRAAFGSRHGMAKLTESQVLQIRALRTNGFSLSELANNFCVCTPLISMICNRRIWKDI